jgi:hypothetical protein
MRRVICICITAAALTAVIAGCGGSSPQTATGHSIAFDVKPARCPTGPGAKRVISTKVTAGPLAPAGVRWTTVCPDYPAGTGRGEAILKGGVLNTALNSAKDMPNQICTSQAVTPMLAILRYQSGTRTFVLELGGCPGVKLHNNTQLSFTQAGLKELSRVQSRSAAGGDDTTGVVPTAARVSGTLGVVGGAQLRGHPKCHCDAQPGTVRLIGAEGTRIDLTAAESGHFSGQVPAGRYDVIAGLKPPYHWPMGSCTGVDSRDARFSRTAHHYYIVVQLGQTVHMDVGCIAG